MDAITFKLKKKKLNAIVFRRRFFVPINQTNDFNWGKETVRKRNKLTGKTRSAPNPIKSRKLSWDNKRKKWKFRKELNWRERERKRKRTMRDAIVTRGSAIAARGSTPSAVDNNAFLRSVAAATRHFFLGFGGQNDAYQWLTIDADRYI